MNTTSAQESSTLSEALRHVGHAKNILGGQVANQTTYPEFIKHNYAKVAAKLKKDSGVQISNNIVMRRRKTN